MLKQAVSDFPYAAPLHALYMKALQQQESYLLPAQVKRTAIATPNREALKAYYESHLEAVAVSETKEKISTDASAEVAVKNQVSRSHLSLSQLIRLLQSQRNQQRLMHLKQQIRRRQHRAK